jgi:DNA-binding beta-propeller fold protein YncE
MEPIMGPHGVAIMKRGEKNYIVVADMCNSRIVAIDDEGSIHIIAGGEFKHWGLELNDGPGIDALFINPRAVAVMENGIIVVADSGHHCIRTIDLDNVVKTIAGTMDSGFQDGPGIEARFNYPSGVVVTPDQTIYVADTDNHCIRAMHAIDGIWHVRTIAGTGIRGFQEGLGRIAQFRHPDGIAVIDDLSIVVTDNHRIRILRPNRLINPDDPNDVLTATDYTVSTVAGTGENGHRDGAGRLAQFGILHGIVVRGDQLFVADSGNGSIRVISADNSVNSISCDATLTKIYGQDKEIHISAPHAIAIMPDQSILVADSISSDIFKISGDQSLNMKYPPIPTGSYTVDGAVGTTSCLYYGFIPGIKF